MRRYKLNISNRKFVIDVQELAANRFEVVVGDNTYEVTLSGDEDMSEATITPGLPVKASGTSMTATAKAVARVRNEPAPVTSDEAPTARPAPRAAVTKKGSLNAPMPGVILEVNVKPGDTVTRGQQVAILDAMKMHNVIGAPRAGTISEVFVSAGQSVNHGDSIVSFTGD